MSKAHILILVSAAAAVVGGVVVATVVWPGPTPPDPDKQEPRETVKYLASEEFGKLKDEQKQQYMEKLVERAETQPFMRRPDVDLSEQERERMFENVRPFFMQMMEQRVDAYLKLPPAERTAYLDRMIDQMAARRQGRGAGGGQPSAGSDTSASGDRRGQGGPHGRGFTPARMKRILETVPPERRAKFVEFMKDMRQRMEQRGIDMRPPSR